ncbi:MAG TPA: tRNA preQ1(34) S-adenosylmethionine ribosyltransferase-isomerase QueA [Planctomycetota bacterium]|nr:tRNA preQ1(34) S-adenosylmethionine ribosyltransferase-isomerase QueA [Planctomycetota bacterium]
MSDPTSRDPEPADPAFDVSRYDYDLPDELVAQEAPAERGRSRMLTVDRASGVCTDGRIDDLPRRLRPGDVLVLNDTRVVKARLEATRADTGGRVELFFLRAEDGAAEALVKTRAFAPEGVRVRVEDAGGPVEMTLGARRDDGVRPVATGLAASELEALLERRGRTPLPPYIRRARGADARDAVDAERYQTVFAATPGAVAAPTAGLHLTRALLERVAAEGVAIARVTLHVGLGTFKPVEVSDLRRHAMHSERYVVDAAAADAVNAARARGGRAVAVGTTAVRALESCADASGVVLAGAGETRLFIHEPYAFRAVDALLTNFHVPRSTLLMLVAAFLGRERTLAAYRVAIGLRYRMLSYGDAMFVG